MKNFTGKLISGLCAAALAASMMSVAALADDEKVNFYEATEQNVKQIGRTLYYQDNLWFANSASGIEFKCTGEKVTFNLKNSGDPTKISVYVNGKYYTKGMFDQKEGSLTIELEEGENVVRLLKLSEAPQSSFAVANIVTYGDGTISPAEANEHSIEFIGDSITCGYGVDNALGTASFSTVNEDASKTYAFYTAQNFGADYSMFAGSGYGVYCQYGGGKNNVMPKFYKQSAPNTWNSVDSSAYVLMQEFDWDFSRYQPELVVINLGTNDYSYFRSHMDDVELFEDTYVDFLKMVRENNPEAQILCTLGLMGAELYPNIENAVEDYTVETGDDKVACVELTPIDPDDGYAVDYHPNQVSHQKCAQELTDAISELMGWETVEYTDDNTSTENDVLEIGEFVDNIKEEESSSENSSESQTSSEEDNSSESSSSESSVDSSSSKASTSSKAASNTTTSNPSTGAVAGFAAVAVIGGAMIAIKKKN